MYDENEILTPGATISVTTKPYEWLGNDRWTPREKKASTPPEPEPITPAKKKEFMARKREMERINKVNVRKGGCDLIREPKLKKDKLKEEEIDPEELNDSKKSSDELKPTKINKKGKDVEKVEEKAVSENKLKPAKSKALSAFGTTFYKCESDSPRIPKKRPSSSSERFGRLKRSRSKDTVNKDEDDRDISETKLKSSRKCCAKVTEDGEDGKGKIRTKGGKSRSMQKIGSDSSLQDGKTCDGKKSSKAKVITAFGSTFRKTENDIPLPKKKTSSFTDRLTRSKSSKLKEVESELEEGTQSKLCLNQSSTKESISKNKLMDMAEECSKDRGKSRGAYSTCTGKRARSPYQTSSEVRANPSKVRVEGDTTGVKQQPEDKAEIGKEMSFFEKLQQNVRAYFSPRSQELAKFEEEKKRVQEGENHPNDESTFIWREDRIMKRFKNFVMITEGEGMKGVFEKGSGSLEKGGKSLTKRNGSGPGGNMKYTSGDIVYRTNYSNQKSCRKVYYIKKGFECIDKRRTASFHRSKTLQKNALAEPPSKFSTSIGLSLEPREQVQNITSAYGVASAFAQVQEFHQEITRRSGIKATSVLVQEEYLTPIVNCLPGVSVTDWTRQEDDRTGVRRSWSRPIRKRCSNRQLVISCKSATDLQTKRLKIHGSRSEGTVQERNIPIHVMTNGLQHGDVPQRLQPTHIVAKAFKPEKIHFVPRKIRWFVYSLTETKISESKLTETPPYQPSSTTAETTPESGVGTCSGNKGVEEFDRREDTCKKAPVQKREISPSFTLKDIIYLTRRISQENGKSENDSAVRDKEESAGQGRKAGKCRERSLGYYLEKLMEEKRDYLNLQKTHNFRKAQKVNFIADSFNFFNLLNKEFLSVKTSNASIETLRNTIAENKDSNVEEYLDMYKKVIRTSLTEPEQCLMDKAKMDLERYTDMYYDLMKCICMEKEGKIPEKGKTICSYPLRLTKSGNTARLNYYEILKADVRRNVNRGSGFFDKIKPRMERPFCKTKIEENRRKREFNTGRNSYRTNNPRKGTAVFDSKEQKLPTVRSGAEKMNQIVELLSPPKNKEATLKKDSVKNGKNEQNSEGKVLLTISVCNDGLIIKQVTESAKGNSDTASDSIKTNSIGLMESSEEDKKTRSNEPLPEEDKYSYLRNSLSEANLGASIGTLSDEVEKTQSELLLKTESDVTVYPKSSIDEENDSSENQIEHPMLKFRAFRKLLSEGLKYLTSFGESPETDRHDCPKITKGGRVPEIFEEQIQYPKTTICVKEPIEQGAKKFDEFKPGQQKSTYVRDPRQTLLRGRGSPVRSAMNETQEKVRKLLKRNLPSYSRDVSPSKISKRRSGREEDSKEKKGANFWWRSERSAEGNPSSVKQRKPYVLPARKPEVNTLAHRISPPSKTFKESESVTTRVSLRGGRKNDDRKQKKSAKKEDDDEYELRESQSDYATPTGSYFEWRNGMKNLKDLLSETPVNTLNPEEVSGTKFIFQEAEEKELHKIDLSGGDERSQDTTLQTPSIKSDTVETGLRLRCSNPLRTEWDQLLEASFQEDYQKVSEVLNQFMGNISEAWKAATYLKDLIKSKSVEGTTKEEALLPIREERNKFSQGEGSQQRNCKNKAIESFRNFLRILTNVFENNQEEALVRRELFLVMKEVLESSSATSSAKAVLKELPNTGNRTVFHEEITQILQEVRDMVAEALVSSDKAFSRTKEDYEPGSFVTAVKDVGEKLKNLYFAPEFEVPTVERSFEKELSTEKDDIVLQPKKIYYHPPKKNLPEKNDLESLTMKSNLQSLAEKINQIYREGKVRAEVDVQKEKKGAQKEEKFVLKKLIRSQSSVYFDATDRCQQSEDGPRVGFCGLPDAKPNRVPLNTVDESYFALSGKTFGKYRDLIYDKIIAFLKSDNPHNINYGMALLGKMMEKDTKPAMGRGPILNKEREEKWYNLVDKLMEMCQVIEAGMKEQLEKRLAVERPEGADGKEIEWVRTCEYLKSHVDKMKALMEEMKEGQRERDSTVRVKALEESRHTNRERQLIAAPNLTGRSFLNQKYLDNAIAFINSIGMIGCSIDKFSKNFFPSWFSGSKESDGPESMLTNSSIDTNDDNFKEAYDSVLECNKANVLGLKKNIDKRQKRIREIIDQATKEGIKREESLSDERLLRKVRDLKKCYNLLEKMICDPTMLPPKWLKLTDESQDADGELFNSIKPETDFRVMTVFQDIVSRQEASRETRLVRYSRSNVSVNLKKTVLDQLPIGLLALINTSFANMDLKYDLPVEGQGQEDGDSDFQRPKTA